MLKIAENSDLSDHTLIIPSVSVGNVGQLTVDLLISSLKLTKIGYVWHRNIIPVAAKADSSDQITTACELFASKELKIVILQIRSTYGPFVKISSLLKDLCKLVKCIVILTGSFAFERRDIQLVNEPISYLLSPKVKSDAFFYVPSTLKKFKEPENPNTPLRIPGGGIADHLYKLCLDEDIPVLALVEFVSEGDNRIDAELMANCVDSILSLRKRSNLDGRRWNPPDVWNSLYGNSFPLGIF